MYYVEFNAIYKKRISYNSQVFERVRVSANLVEGGIEEGIDREKWCKWNMNEW